MVKAPCQGCLDRFVGCRSGCPEWQQYQVEKEVHDEKVRQGRLLENEHRKFCIDLSQKIRKGQNRR